MDGLEIARCTAETFYMVWMASLFATLIGLPMGLLLVLTAPQHLLACPRVHHALGAGINVLRSMPFMILMIACMPLTKFLVGTSLGVHAAIVPLVVGAAPFYARLVQVAVGQVDPGSIEMGRSFGASTWQIVWYILLPEARVGILAGITVTMVALVGYSAMAGVVGGGGLGDLAIRYGYQRFQMDVMAITTLILIVWVHLLQSLSDRLIRNLSHRKT